MAQRWTYRRRHTYKTAGNIVKLVKTPGNKLSVQYRAKKAKGVHCGDCGAPLSGIPHVSAARLHSLSKRQKTVTRAYGGNRCARCVRQRILRAFLLEEQKIVKRVVKEQSKGK